MMEKLNNMTIAEMVELRDFSVAVFSIPEKIPEPLPYRFHTAFPYEGRHEIDKAKIYDAEMAEISAEKSARAEKFRKTHDMRKKSKDDTPADRRKNSIDRMHRLYGTVFNDGKDWYWENGKEGQKKSTEPDAEIFRNLKVAEMEKSAYADMIPDAEHYVGKTTLSGMMRYLWKKMTEIKKPYQAAGYSCYLRYYCKRGNIFDSECYPSQYYDILDDYDYLEKWSEVLADKKLGRESAYTPEEITYFCESGKRVFDRLMRKYHPEPEYINDGWPSLREIEEALDKRYWESISAELNDYCVHNMGQEDYWEEWEDD